MKGTIYLLGGGEIAEGETRRIDADIKASAKKNDLLAFFGTASGDARGYANMIEWVFGDHFTILNATEDEGEGFARTAIHSASVIYLGGGETQLLLDRFEEWDLVEDLRSAYERGTTIVGMSAGAQALCKTYIHEEKKRMELRKGWGLVDMCCLVHATERSYKKAKKLCKDVVGISEKAAWVVDEKGVSMMGEGVIMRTLAL